MPKGKDEAEERRVWRNHFNTQMEKSAEEIAAAKRGQAALEKINQDLLREEGKREKKKEKERLFRKERSRLSSVKHLMKIANKLSKEQRLKLKERIDIWCQRTKDAALEKEKQEQEDEDEEEEEQHMVELVVIGESPAHEIEKEAKEVIAEESIVEEGTFEKQVSACSENEETELAFEEVTAREASEADGELDRESVLGEVPKSKEEGEEEEETQSYLEVEGDVEVDEDLNRGRDALASRLEQAEDERISSERVTMELEKMKEFLMRDEGRRLEKKAAEMFSTLGDVSVEVKKGLVLTLTLTLTLL